MTEKRDLEWIVKLSYIALASRGTLVQGTSGARSAVAMLELDEIREAYENERDIANKNFREVTGLTDDKENLL